MYLLDNWLGLGTMLETSSGLSYSLNSWSSHALS